VFRLINLVAKGVTTVTDQLSKVEALLDDCLTSVAVQYTGCSPIYTMLCESRHQISVFKKNFDSTRTLGQFPNAFWLACFYLSFCSMFLFPALKEPKFFIFSAICPTILLGV